jgi:hypothetical protein
LSSGSPLRENKPEALDVLSYGLKQLFLDGPELRRGIDHVWMGAVDVGNKRIALVDPELPQPFFPDLEEA